MPENDVVLGLGSNLGDSAMILQGAVDDLDATDGIDIDAVSPVYETDPVGGVEQPAFLNLVALGRTSLLDHELLAATQAIEQRWHRTREVHWGPRTLDIDIIALGQRIVSMPDLNVPHPLAHERAFVLVPWCDLDPDAVVPGHGPLRNLLAALDVAGVRRTPIVVAPTTAG